MEIQVNKNTKYTVSKQFEAFYKEISPIIGPHEFLPTTNPHQGSCQFKNGKFLIALRTDLSKKNFEHHTAHELMHAVQCKEGWPSIIPSNVSLRETRHLLQSGVADLDVEDRLGKWSFDPTWILDKQYSNLQEEIKRKDVKTISTLDVYNIALKYAHALLTQPLLRRDILSQLLTSKMPLIANKGNEIVEILKNNGWSSPEQVLKSTINIRQCLGIENNKLIIKDNLNGLKF